MSHLNRFAVIFIILIFNFSIQLHADAKKLKTDRYYRKLQAIEFEGNDAFISLSDGSVFRWIPQEFEKTMLSPWKKEDIIENRYSLR